MLSILARTLLTLGQGSILEPFAVSASTLGACEALGYDATGVELDEEYVQGLEQHIDAFSRPYPHFKGDRLTMLEEPEANIVKLNPKRNGQPTLF